MATEPGNGEMWMVRAGAGGAYAEHFLNNRVVAVGWAGVGEIAPDDSDADIRRRFETAFPQDTPAQIRSASGQVKRFVREVAVGDEAVTYNPQLRLYHIGVIRSDAEVQERPAGGEQRTEYVRQVDWVGEVARDRLSAVARQSLTALMTLFRVNDEAKREFRAILSGEHTGAAGQGVEAAAVSESDEAEAAYTLAEYAEKSEQLIEDQIARLGPYQMQDLVAGILRAMGYRTRVSEPGPDRGVDIFASRDGLGLEEPRIFAEVKQRGGTVGASEVRSFLGGRRAGDRCLYVSTGGFSREARFEAERSPIPVTLIAMPELRTLLVDYYEDLDPETRALVPLRRIYWPAEE